MTRLAGFPDVVTLDDADPLDAALILDDHDEYLRLDTSTEPIAEAIPAPWRSDDAAERVIVAWVERYLEDGHHILVIRRDYFTDLIVDPLSELFLDRLAFRFGYAHIDQARDFLAAAAPLFTEG